MESTILLIILINGIEGFWSYAKHILYNYRGVSKYHFPMYLKEIEYRFNHREENIFKDFIRIYFGYISLITNINYLKSMEN